MSPVTTSLKNLAVQLSCWPHCRWQTGSKRKSEWTATVQASYLEGCFPYVVKNISVYIKFICLLIYVKLTVGYLSITHLYTHKLMVKPTKFLWLLLEIESCAKGIGRLHFTGYHKISDTVSYISFHFYATLLLEKYFGEKTWALSPLSTYGDKEL